MNDKVSDKQIREFVQMLDSHLARLIHAAEEHLIGLSHADWEGAVKTAFILAWRNRESIDLATKSLPVWFGELVGEARHSVVFPSDDEMRVLAAFSEDLQPVKKSWTSMTITHVRAEPPQKVGKECPPCWRCKYHQGWLPVASVPDPAYEDAEMAAICRAIDERKVAIAHYVRDDSDTEEAELPDEPVNTF